MTSCKLCAARKKLEHESEDAIKRGEVKQVGDGGIIWLVRCDCNNQKIVRVR